jgi:hypothetical protein
MGVDNGTKKLEKCNQTKTDNSKVFCLRFEKHVQIKTKKGMVQFLVFIKVIPNLDKGFLGR